MAIKQLPDLERALHTAHARDASDMFLIPGEPLSFRVKGIIERSNDSNVFTSDQIRSIATAAIGEQQLEAQLAATGQAHTAVSIPGTMSGQMYVARAGGQLTIAVRILLGRLPDAAEIKLPQVVLDLATRTQRGLMIFTGPTGSGKTTTALAVLDHINATQQKVICTVEDPVATASLVPKRSLLVQREVGTDVPDTPAGIVASLTQDADVLFVGEMRNPQEVSSVITAAHVRSLVLTQMHQRTATGAIRRLIELPLGEGAQGFRRQLAEVLTCVVAQALVPRATGPGRVAIYGVLIPDEETRRAIVEGREIVHRSSLLEEHARQLAADGTIEQQVAARAIQEQGIT